MIDRTYTQLMRDELAEIKELVAASTWSDWYRAEHKIEWMLGDLRQYIKYLQCGLWHDRKRRQRWIRRHGEDWSYLAGVVARGEAYVAELCEIRNELTAGHRELRRQARERDREIARILEDHRREMEARKGKE